MKTEADLNISIEGKQVFKVKFGCRIMILVKNNAVHVFRHDQQHHPCHPPPPPSNPNKSYIYIHSSDHNQSLSKALLPQILRRNIHLHSTINFDTTGNHKNPRSL